MKSMIVPQIAVLLSATLAAVALPQPIISPPVDMLAPPVNDFPRKGPPLSRDDKWEELTKGTNLALGKSYRFDRKPDYWVTQDPGDALQLTDGKIIPGDHIWYYKEAVGYASCEPPVTICIDLGKVYPIDAVVAHVQGGGARGASFRYPLRFDVFVSDDDQTYHLVDSVSKREFVDQQGSLFDIPESDDTFPPGQPHTQAFNFGNLRTQGRYVALRMKFAYGYNALDEIAVMAGNHDPASVTFDPRYATRLLFDGVSLVYPALRLQVPTNVAGSFSFSVRDSRQDSSKPATFHIAVPSSVQLSWSGKEPLVAKSVAREGRSYTEYSLTANGVSSELYCFYIQANPPKALNSKSALGHMYFHAEADGIVQPEQSV